MTMAPKSKGIVKSSWTPLSNEEANNKIFDERRSLVNKWFEKWNTTQRKLIIDDLLTKCTLNQADYARTILTTKAPQNHVDFTRTLPRVLCLYIFSFLDPRSLCRASRVCWYWKYLCETNEIWIPKCLKFGWLDSSDSLNTMEQGLMKKIFIQNVMQLQLSRPNKEKEKREQLLKELTALELARLEEEEKKRKLKRYHDKIQRNSDQLQKSRPWKGPDPKPIDIIRNNYIENDVEIGSKRKSQRSAIKTSSLRRVSSSQERHRSHRISRPSSAQKTAVEAPASFRLSSTARGSLTEAQDITTPHSITNKYNQVSISKTIPHLPIPIKNDSSHTLLNDTAHENIPTPHSAISKTPITNNITSPYSNITKTTVINNVTTNSNVTKTTQMNGVSNHHGLVSRTVPNLPIPIKHDPSHPNVITPHNEIDNRIMEVTDIPSGRPWVLPMNEDDD